MFEFSNNPFRVSWKTLIATMAVLALPSCSRDAGPRQHGVLPECLAAVVTADSMASVRCDADEAAFPTIAHVIQLTIHPGGVIEYRWRLVGDPPSRSKSLSAQWSAVQPEGPGEQPIVRWRVVFREGGEQQESFILHMSDGLWAIPAIDLPGGGVRPGVFWMMEER